MHYQFCINCGCQEWNVDQSYWRWLDDNEIKALRKFLKKYPDDELKIMCLECGYFFTIDLVFLEKKYKQMLKEKKNESKE